MGALHLRDASTGEMFGLQDLQILESKAPESNTSGVQKMDHPEQAAGNSALTGHEGFTRR